MAVKSVRRAVRGLANVSVEDLNREMVRRQKVASQLEIKRARLLSKVAELEREIRGHGVSLNGTTIGHGDHAGAGRPRGGRSTTLAGALADLLKGRTMHVKAMSAAVQKAGYKTKSPTFRTIVNATLLNRSDLFRRVGWGQYTAK